jgi:hypothetical protein
MIPTDLRSKLNTLLANTAAQISAAEEDYMSLHGRYWQAARTHAVPPADGATVAPDLTRKPSDETTSWSSMGLVLPAQIEAALSVHVYRSRAGHGYVLNADVIVAGVHYRRSRNFGPEPWHERDWHARKTIPMT